MRETHLMNRLRFLRSDTVRHVRLGKNKRRLQKWRRPRGRHSKIRRKRFGYPVQPSIGYKQSARISGLVKGKIPSYVIHIKDLRSLQKGDLIIVSRRLGAKKRLELFKQAQEKHLIVLNGKERSRETK